MGQENGTGREVKTATTIFTIIESVQMLDGASVSELSDHVGLAKSTIHNHVKTLVKNGYLIESNGEYHLGLKFLDHAYHAKQRLRVTDAISPTIEKLAEETGELAWVVVEEHGLAINLNMAETEQAVRTADRTGLRTHLHFHAAGKAILAHLPAERVNEIFEERGLPAATERTITDQRRLEEELETIRERGYAVNDGEAVKGLRSVAAPIIVNGQVIAAITVIGPSKRLKGKKFHEKIPEAVQGAANAIELELTHS